MAKHKYALYTDCFYYAGDKDHWVEGLDKRAHLFNSPEEAEGEAKKLGLKLSPSEFGVATVDVSNPKKPLHVEGALSKQDKEFKAKCLKEDWDLVTVLEVIEEDGLEMSPKLKKEITALPKSAPPKLSDLDAWDFDKLSLDSLAELCDLVGADEEEFDEEDEEE
jgi:hypothetical protein